MKNKQLIITIVVIIVVGVGGFWLGFALSGRGDVNRTNTKTTAQAGNDSTGRKILYWKDPMEPQKIYHHPGKSDMGMTLQPVYAGEAHKKNKGMVKINPVVQQDMNVHTATAKSVPFSTTIRTVGSVKYDEQLLHAVSPRISGWIDTLYINYTGQTVHKGDPMLSIYSPKLVTTQREYLLALHTKNVLSNSSFPSIGKNGESLLKSTRKRLEYWNIPTTAINRLKQTGKIQKILTLRAPAAGVVIKKNVVDGDHIKEGETLYKIADLSKVWVEANIYSNELPWIHKGQQARMQLSYLPDKTFIGKISYIYPYVNKKTRTVKVRIIFNNPKGILKPGMYGNVRLQGKEIPHATVIPLEAVIHTGTRTLVVRALGNGMFKPQDVKLGVIGGHNFNKVQVLSGLQPGDSVVTSAQFLFDSESRLQSAIQKMLHPKKNNGMNMKGMNMEQDTMDIQPKKKFIIYEKYE
jgi:Cu(I)/Ag(I) efflux system membrane fusion protein/cobalt-zinc-cadmium efflux system membrane fusion protein